MTDERLVMCQTCQGNGEIVTDWERYKHPRPGDVGDEAVTECPNCDGTGEVSELDTMSTADLPELLPCPFCGEHFVEEAESAVPTIHGGNKRAVYCNGCFAEGPTADTPAEAIAAWNERAGDKRAREAVPEGWKLVPVEPTEEMLAAAHEADREYTLRTFGDVMTVQQGPYDHYKAMLRASPSPDMLEKR